MELNTKKKFHVNSTLPLTFIFIRLEEIKNGVIIKNISINEKAFYLIGKLPKLSDIRMLHPTISRKHAVI